MGTRGHTLNKLITNTFQLTAGCIDIWLSLQVWLSFAPLTSCHIKDVIGADWDHPLVKWEKKKIIWQNSRFHCEVSVWGPGSGSLAACLSRPTFSASHPQAATGKICSHKTQKEWHQSHFNGSWIIVPLSLHPTEPKGWLAPLQSLGAAYVFPCDPCCCLWADSAW